MVAHFSFCVFADCIPPSIFYYLHFSVNVNDKHHFYIIHKKNFSGYQTISRGFMLMNCSLQVGCTCYTTMKYHISNCANCQTVRLSVVSNKSQLRVEECHDIFRTFALHEAIVHLGNTYNYLDLVLPFLHVSCTVFEYSWFSCHFL